MTTIRVRNPLDLVTVLPYQFGFHPTESLVLVGVRRGHLGLVQRLDLPDPAQSGDVVRLLLRHLRQDRCTAAVVIVYEDQPGSGDAVADALVDALLRTRIDVLERMVVRRGRVYFPNHLGSAVDDETAYDDEAPVDDEAAQGLPLPAEWEVPAVADFVALGRRPSLDREAFGQCVAPQSGPMATRVATAARRIDGLKSGRDEARRALVDWGRWLAVADPHYLPHAEPSAAAAARMLVSLRDRQVRDLLTAWLCPGTLELSLFEPTLVAQARASLPAPCDDPEHPDPEHEDRVVERLAWLCRTAPEDLAPAALTVLASFTWWLGDGTKTRFALERALLIDPSYRLAQLLERMLDLAIRPQRTG